MHYHYLIVIGDLPMYTRLGQDVLRSFGSQKLWGYWTDEEGLVSDAKAYAKACGIEAPIDLKGAITLLKKAGWSILKELS